MSQVVTQNAKFSGKVKKGLELEKELLTLGHAVMTFVKKFSSIFILFILLTLLLLVPYSVINIAKDKDSLRNLFISGSISQSYALGLLNDTLENISGAVNKASTPFGVSVRTFMEACKISIGKKYYSYCNLINLTWNSIGRYMIYIKNYDPALNLFLPVLWFPLIFVFLIIAFILTLVIRHVISEFSRSQLDYNQLFRRIFRSIVSIFTGSFLYIFSITSLYSFIIDRKLLTLLPLITKIAKSLPTLLGRITLVLILLLIIYTILYLTGRHIIIISWLLFFAWYTLFWGGVFGLWQGTTFSIAPRVSLGYVHIAISLLIFILLPYFLLITPFVLYLSSHLDRYLEIDLIIDIVKKMKFLLEKILNNTDEKTIMHLSLRRILSGLWMSLSKLVNYWKLFYTQVILYGGGLGEILFISFTIGIFLTIFNAVLPLFYSSFIRPELFEYTNLSISTLLQDFSVLIGAIGLWLIPMLGLLFFPERLISGSMATKIRSLLSSSDETIAIVSGSNRMVRALLDKLIPYIIRNSDRNSDFILKEDATLSNISRNICIIDYTNTLSDISYEDPLVGTVGLMEIELDKSEKLLIPCLSKYGGDRADNVKDLLNTLSTITGKEPAAVIVASRDRNVQVICMERFVLGMQKGNTDGHRCIVIPTEKIIDYRMFHNIFYSINRNLSRNESMRSSFFFEIYHNTAASAMLHRILSLLSVERNKENMITVIGSSRVLGYLMGLLLLADRYIPDGGLSLNLVIYPRLPKRSSFFIHSNKSGVLESGHFLRWAKREKTPKQFINTVVLPKYPLHTLLQDYKVREKLESILNRSQVLAFVEDPKEEGRSVGIAEALLFELKGASQNQERTNREKRIFIGEGNLLSLKKELLQHIEERYGVDVEANYLYNEIMDPFAVICRELIPPRNRDTKIYNVYLCAEEADIVDIINGLEDDENSPDARSEDSKKTSGALSIFLPKMYSCSCNPRKNIVETFVRKNNEIYYTYLCVPRREKLADVLSEGTLNEIINKSQQLKPGEDKPRIEVSKLVSKEKKKEVKIHRCVVFPCMKYNISSKLGEGEEGKHSHEDQNCPQDGICPLAFLGVKSCELIIPRELKASEILHLRTRPCIANDETKRVLIELYLKPGQRKAADDKKMKIRESDVKLTPQLRLLRDICPIISHMKSEKKCNSGEMGKFSECSDYNNVYFYVRRMC